MEQYLEHLNTQQREAVVYCDGPQLVIAGAGSGKTRVLTYKIVHLLKNGMPPYRIMALTFTNKAAREMRERIEKLVGSDLSRQLWMGTFHSIFGRLLRINAERIGFGKDYTIYDTADSRALLKMVIKDLNLSDTAYKPADIQYRISNLKNALISPDDYEMNGSFRQDDNNARRPDFYRVYKMYCDRCRIANAMDFDDLLFYTNVLLRDCPDVLEKYQDFFQYILVDEYQDTNFAQHLIILRLSEKHNRLCVVGDDAQSIYSFRGANIDNILKLKNSFKDLQTFKLERNYRSTQTIINAANSLIEKNRRQIKKRIYSENDVGERIPFVVYSRGEDEAYGVAREIIAIKARQGDSYNDFAILYRTHAQSRAIEEALRRGGLHDAHGNVRDPIPYRIFGGLAFYQRKEIKDVVAYLRLTANQNDDEALKRIINLPKRGIGDTTMAKVQHLALENGVSLWDVICSPTDYSLEVNQGTMTKLNEFVNLINGFISMNEGGTDAHTIAKTIILNTRLLDEYVVDNTPENISRKENVEELLNGIKSYVQDKNDQGDEDNKLANYLGEISLLTDQDTDEVEGDKVTLTTAHSAKGLEFKNVFIIGMEEGLFPSQLSMDSLRELEEERRLFYVAITRAKKNCIISYAKSRFYNGQFRFNTKSRFISDINRQFLRISDNSDGEMEVFTKRPATTFRFSSDVRPTTKPTLTTRHHQSATPLQHNQAKTSDAFKTHTASEIAVGNVIQHSRFGEGTITKIDVSGADPKMVVKFDTGEARTLLLKFARFFIISR